MDVKTTKKYYGGGRLHLKAWTGMSAGALDEMRETKTGRILEYNGHKCEMVYLNGEREPSVRLRRDGEDYGVFSLVSEY